MKCFLFEENHLTRWKLRRLMQVLRFFCLSVYSLTPGIHTNYNDARIAGHGCITVNTQQDQSVLTLTVNMAGVIYLQCTLYIVTFWTTNTARNWRTQGLVLRCDWTSPHMCEWLIWCTSCFQRGDLTVFHFKQIAESLCAFCDHALLPVWLLAKIPKNDKLQTRSETSP